MYIVFYHTFIQTHIVSQMARSSPKWWDRLAVNEPLHFWRENERKSQNLEMCLEAGFMWEQQTYHSRFSLGTFLFQEKGKVYGRGAKDQSIELMVPP